MSVTLYSYFRQRKFSKTNPYAADQSTNVLREPLFLRHIRNERQFEVICGLISLTVCSQRCGNNEVSLRVGFRGTVLYIVQLADGI